MDLLSEVRTERPITVHKRNGTVFYAKDFDSIILAPHGNWVIFRLKGRDKFISSTKFKELTGFEVKKVKVEKKEEKKEEKEDRNCVVCDCSLPEDAHYATKYCSDECRNSNK